MRREYVGSCVDTRCDIRISRDILRVFPLDCWLELLDNFTWSNSCNNCNMAVFEFRKIINNEHN